MVEVDRGNPFQAVRVVEEELDAPSPGQVVVEVERFSIATNNLGYALLGDVLGFWNAFPAAPGWGRPPVWGVARVVAGDPELADVGTQLTGFLPMGTHASVRARPDESGIISDDVGRRDLLPFYRRLSVTDAEDDPYDDVAVALLHVIPFAGVLAADLLNRGAAHVVLSSASSRSAAALARLLTQAGVETTGLTSVHHRDATRTMAAYSRVVTYEEMSEGLASGSDVIYVDVAGSSNVTSTVHRLLGNRLAESVIVGGTHVRQLPDQSAATPLPGPAPVQFSTGDREQEIAGESGHHTVVELNRRARAELVPWVAGWLRVRRLKGVASAADLWRETARGHSDPLTATVVLP